MDTKFLNQISANWFQHHIKIKIYHNLDGFRLDDNWQSFYISKDAKNNNKVQPFFMIKQQRSLSKLVIKQSFLNPLKGIYRYLTANMIFKIEILKAKHLK